MCGVARGADFACDNLTVTTNITQSSASGVVNIGGKLGFGTAAPAAALDMNGNGLATSGGWLSSDGAYGKGIYFNPDGGITLYKDSCEGPGWFAMYREGSGGTAVSKDTVIGIHCFWARDMTNSQKAALIRAYVDADPGTNDMPGRIEFLTTPDGAKDPALRLTVKNDGKVGIGTNLPSALLDEAYWGQPSK
jgi:hypothetical protein